MKLKSITLVFFIWAGTIYAQKEASFWPFGEAGVLDFSSGAMVQSIERRAVRSSSSISDANGNLLFYTNGETVFNRNYEVMLNGNVLISGEAASSIIVPKPGYPNIYYVFNSVAFKGIPTGLEYSEVDLTLDGGAGGVTSNKRVLLNPSVGGSVAAIKSADCLSFWVVTRAQGEFLAYNVSPLGVNKIPVVSAGRSGSKLKFSPNGKKIAFFGGLLKGVDLCDFDNSTGVISNCEKLSRYNTFGYVTGIEFSPDTNFLYTAVYVRRALGVDANGEVELLSEGSSRVFQYNLNGDIDAVIDSETELINKDYKHQLYDMQLAPDGKIYVANREYYNTNERYKIDVINNPEAVGLACDYSEGAVNWNAHIAVTSFPNFAQSFFYEQNIIPYNTCVGGVFDFSLKYPADTVVWDFGDPSSGDNNTSTALTPTHVFSKPGVYHVSVKGTYGDELISDEVAVFVTELKGVKQVELTQCENDTDGFSVFNLYDSLEELGVRFSPCMITFHKSKIDAENGDAAIENPVAYVNQKSKTDVVWARIGDYNHCYGAIRVDLRVVSSQIPDTFVRNFYVCDDDKVAGYGDGISTFDFSEVEEEIKALFLGDDFNISYYRSEIEALTERNKIPDISNHRNVGSPKMQRIYVRVESKNDNACMGIGAFINLHVEPFADYGMVVGRACVDNEEGVFSFDTSNIEQTIFKRESLAGVPIIYLDENGESLPSPLPNPFLTSTQTITVRLGDANTIGDNNCYNETFIKFIVDKNPKVYDVPSQVLCADVALEDEIGSNYASFDTSLIESTLLGGQIGMKVIYYDANGDELPSPLPNPFISSTQTITAEVLDEKTRCAVYKNIDFIVKPLPEFSIETPQLVCSSEPTFTIVLDPEEVNAAEVYDYEWSGEDGAVLSNKPTLIVSSPGTYSVTLTKTDGSGCSITKDVFVNNSELATITIDDITIEDGFTMNDTSKPNSVTINTDNLGQGDYEFALGDESSSYQDEPVFNNVSLGVHTVYVRDKKGCGTSSVNVPVIGFPKYFTPNGDGINDFWNIGGVNSEFQLIANISIYDRHGKLIKKIAANSEGWDGTLNGVMLPTDDYWFSALLEGGKVFSGHFALKR